MSIKDLVTGLENRIDGLFAHSDPVDPVPLRDPVLAAIARAEQQWASPPAGGHADWFSEDNGSVAFSPTMPNGAPLTIDGLTTSFIPAERFADYLAAMRAQVDAGAFDAEIAAAVGGSPNVSGLATVAMPERRQGAAGENREQQRGQSSQQSGDTLDRAG